MILVTESFLLALLFFFDCGVLLLLLGLSVSSSLKSEYFRFCRFFPYSVSQFRRFSLHFCGEKCRCGAVPSTTKFGKPTVGENGSLFMLLFELGDLLLFVGLK